MTQKDRDIKDQAQFRPTTNLELQAQKEGCCEECTDANWIARNDDGYRCDREWCPCHQRNEIEEWKLELLKKSHEQCQSTFLGERYYEFEEKTLLSHVENLLAEQRSKMIAVVEGMKVIVQNDRAKAWDIGYNQALDDVISSLEKEV